MFNRHQGRIGTGIFHAAAFPAILHERHCDRLDALLVDEIIHDDVEHGAFEIIYAIVDEQQRHGFVDGRLVEIQLALAAFFDHPRVGEVTGDFSARYAFAFDGVQGRSRLGHVKEMIVVFDAVEDRVLVQGVFDTSLCARIIKGIFEIGISI